MKEKAKTLVDIAKLMKQKLLDSFESSIGKLWLYACSLRDKYLLTEILPLKLESALDEEVIKGLIKFSCFPDESLAGEKIKPNSTQLTVSDLGKLATNDLEEFAKIYLDKNPYLYTKQGSKFKSESEGKLVLTIFNEDIECPRVVCESDIEYLSRLTILELTELNRKALDVGKSFGGFSTKVADSLRRNIQHGNELIRSLDNLKQDSKVNVEFDRPNTKIMDTLEHVAANREAPLKELSIKLDRIIDSSVRSSEFMIESNMIQAQVAEEVKASGDAATLSSKKSLWISVAVIILTILGLMMTFLSMYKDNQKEAT